MCHASLRNEDIKRLLYILSKELIFDLLLNSVLARALIGAQCYEMVYILVCVYVCLKAHICDCMFVNVWICMLPNICSIMYVHMHVKVFMYIWLCVHVSMFMNVYTSAYLYLYLCVGEYNRSISVYQNNDKQLNDKVKRFCVTCFIFQKNFIRLN